MSTMFQDSAGTTPVTAVEQRVGLILDKSKGLVLGPELVTNGDFSGGTTGWSTGSGWAISGGEAVRTATGIQGGLSQSVIATQGRTYLIQISVVVTTGSIVGIRLGSVSTITPSISSSGVYSYRVACDGTNNTLVVLAQTNFSGTIDNISVRELPGFHAFQTTSTSRPRLSARYNLLNNTDVLSTQSRNVRNVKHIVSFSGTGSVALSGAFTGTLAGTGANDRVHLEFTPTAGSLTLTVSGLVEKAQLEEV
jgi:hypothetical protein